MRQRFNYGFLATLKLPNGDKADIGDKLEKYSLNPFHRQGQHKARLFASVLGITSSNAEVLKTALRRAAEESDSAVPLGNNGYGDVYVLRFPLTTEKGTATVLSGRIVRNGEHFPRLTTCYILLPMNGQIQMHDIVALLEDTQAAHFETGQPLMLRRGQIGTVVMTYDGTAFEIEFADGNGRAYAMLPIRRDKLMVLRDSPEVAAA